MLRSGAHDRFYTEQEKLDKTIDVDTRRVGTTEFGTSSGRKEELYESLMPELRYESRRIEVLRTEKHTPIRARPKTARTPSGAPPVSGSGFLEVVSGTTSLELSTGPGPPFGGPVDPAQSSTVIV